MVDVNLTDINLTNFNSGIIQKVDGRVFYKSVCSQINNYFIKTGLIIVIIYIFFCWFNWWFFNYGYKKLKYDNNSKFWKYIGNLDYLENRIYWDNFIKMKLLKLTIGFIVVMLYFNL